MWSYGQCADTIVGIVREINLLFSMLVDFLTNDSVYQSTIKAVPDLVSAIKGTAIVLCTMFFLVDFFTKTLHLQWVTWENVMMLMLKLIVAKVCVDNAEFFTTSLYNGFNSFVNVIAGSRLKNQLIEVVDGHYERVYTYFVSETQASYIINNTANGGYFNSGFMNFAPMILNLQISIQGLAMKVIMIIANVVVIARLFELAVYTMVAPIPLSTFACDGLSDVGKGFLKSYAAVCLQSLVLAIMFIAYTAINDALIVYKVQDENLALNGILGLVMTLTLGISVLSSGAWSKKICGAM